MNSNTNDESNLPPYVLALTIVCPQNTRASSGSAEEGVLFCVRNREVNLTHPDVVSVPTQRIPSSVGQKLDDTGTPNGVFGDTQLLSSAKISNSETDGHNAMIYAIEALLARKMGVANHLESNELMFTAELSGYHHGRARYPKGTGANRDVDDDEELKMLNLLIQIDKGAHLFPDSTISYGVQKWTTVSKFIKMWDSKDPTIVGLTPEQAIGCCVDGLCITSTYDILSAKRN